MINCFPDSVREGKRALMENLPSGATNPGEDEEPAPNPQKTERRLLCKSPRKGTKLTHSPREMRKHVPDGGRTACGQVTEDHGLSQEIPESVIAKCQPSPA